MFFCWPNVVRSTDRSRKMIGFALQLHRVLKHTEISFQRYQQICNENYIKRGANSCTWNCERIWISNNMQSQLNTISMYFPIPSPTFPLPCRAIWGYCKFLKNHNELEKAFRLFNYLLLFLSLPPSFPSAFCCRCTRFNSIIGHVCWLQQPEIVFVWESLWSLSANLKLYRFWECSLCSHTKNSTSSQLVCFAKWNGNRLKLSSECE